MPQSIRARDAQQITGSERLAWDQPAGDAGEPDTIGYALYVDGTRSDLADVSCERSRPDAGFACSTGLPVLSAGVRWLQLASFIVTDRELESTRSEPLVVHVTSAAVPGAPPPTESSGPLLTADGVVLRVEVVADHVDHANDLAFTPDGALLIAERGGALAIRRDEVLLRDRAPIEDLSVEGGGLLAIAADPQFESSRFIYVLYTARSDGGVVPRLARLREAGGTFADRIVLFEQPLAARIAAAALRVADDGTLHFAVADSIQRLNPDGTTPANQASLTPTYATGVTGVTGLDWQPRSGYLWTAETAITGTGRLTLLADSKGSRKRGATVATRALPFNPSSLAFYRAAAVPSFANDLFVASHDAHVLLRLHFDASDATTAIMTERLLENRVGGIRAAAVAPSGAIYLATDERVVRLVAVPR